MKKIHTFLCLIFALFAMNQSSFAQNVWQNISNVPTTLGGVRQIIPQKFRLVQLNNIGLSTILNQSPLEFTPSGFNTNSILELPTPDGKMLKFAIVESPIMEQALAKKFPEIKTYAGYCVDNKAITVRFDVTPSGFHAMVLSPEGTFFIDPYSTGTKEFYMSYNKNDFISTQPFSCDQENVQQPNTNSIKLNDDKNPPKNSPFRMAASFGDSKLRTYRLALAATGEYTAYHGGTVAGALAAQVTAMNRVNGIYIKDFAVRLNIVANNNLIIYTDGATDPYTNNNGGTMLSQNISNLNAIIGSANYDVGHVFSTGGGGVAYLAAPCSSFKAGGVTGLPSPTGDPFYVDYVAHEMGHQFNGQHSFNNSCGGNINSSTAAEPGSGSTIMAYAGICSPNVQSFSDDYFHGINLAEMHTFIVGAGNTCAAQPSYTNATPAISSNTASQTIPKGTPFVLTGTASDADGNGSLTYCWEQMDTEIRTQPPISTATGGPIFRSLNPSNNNARYFPKLNDLVNNTTTIWEVLPTVARSLKFRLVVRDNAVGGGFNDSADIILTVNGTSGPFIVNIPNATSISWSGTSTETVTWSVANTNLAPVSCSNVDILLSTDGGLTYPTTLASNVPNSGTASVTVPNVSTTTARIMVRGTGRAFFDISNNNFAIMSVGTCTPPTGATAGSNSPVLVGGIINLTSSSTGGTSQVWGGPSGFTSNAQNPSIASANLGMVGIYTVTITSSGTCAATATTSVVVNPLPTSCTPPTGATAGSNSPVLVGGTINLTSSSTGGTSQVWAGPSGFSSTAQNPSIASANLGMAGIYTVTITSSGTCAATATTSVVVNPLPTGTVVFVNVANVSPTQDGNSWATAYSNLQTALSTSPANSEIWVAQGTYKPTASKTQTIYFNIPSGTMLFGGFVGTEVAQTQRNFKNNPSILSGEIGLISTVSDNSYHVVLFDGANNTTRLDGFTITGGNANLGTNPFTNPPNYSSTTPVSINDGGGIALDNGSSPMVINCKIINNQGTFGGGLFATNASNPSVINCAFMGNQATFGGGVYHLGSNPSYNNVLFAGNKATGGAVYNNGSNPTITNSTIAGNGGLNGSIFNSVSTPIVKNSIIYGNVMPFNDTQSVVTFSIVEGGFTGVGNLNLDPKFVNPTHYGLSPNTSGDYQLTNISPAIDAGENSAISLTDKDLMDNLRRFNGGIVDMGAYEFQGSRLGGTIISIISGNWENGSTWMGGISPLAGDNVIINNNHNVTILNLGSAKNVEIRTNAKITYDSISSKLQMGI